MIINGANLGKQEVEYQSLTSFDDLPLESKEEISFVEQLYKNISSRSEDFSINEFPITNDGKVDIKPGMVNHGCSGNLEALANISKYGVLASEWFGILESECEGRFCVFVSRTKNEDYPFTGTLAEDNYTRLNIGKNVLLFFDEQNPIFQYLLHLDYFEYESIKEKNKEQIEQIYTKEEINMFDNLIEPLSPGGKGMRKNYDFKTNYWSAIPGGIPSFLVNGICIKNNEYTDEQLDRISMLFPQATIFKGDLDIVRYSNNHSKEDENNRSII